MKMLLSRKLIYLALRFLYMVAYEWSKHYLRC